MERKFTLQINAYDMFTREYITYPSEKQTVTLKPGQNTELGAVKNPDTLTEESLIILSATLVEPSTGTAEARLVDWPEPFRYLQWHPATKVELSVRKLADDDDWTDEVRVVANHPVKGCMLYVGYDEGEDGLWEDNMLDLMPGEELVVRAKELNDRAVQTRFLNDWELRNH